MPNHTDISRRSRPDFAAAIGSPSPSETQSIPVSSRPRTIYRDDSLDIAKGFGITMVVLGQCLLGLINAGFFPASASWPDVVTSTIYLFHMPLFFVISGHLTSGKRRPPAQTIAKMLPTLVYPYFLWSILQGLAQAYLTRFTPGHMLISSLYRILWIPIGPYWFLYSLFLSQVVYLAIRKRSHGLQISIAAALFLVPFLLYRLTSFTLPLIVFESTRGFLFFILGVVSVQHIKQFGRWMAMAATAFFAVLATVIYQSQWGAPTLSLVSVPAACAGIMATLAWACVLAPHRHLVLRILSFLGRYSMSIYVMHIFFTAGIRILIQRLHPRSTQGMTFLEIVTITSLGIVIPLGINWLVSRLFLDKWLGLPHMESSLTG